MWYVFIKGSDVFCTPKGVNRYDAKHEGALMVGDVRLEDGQYEFSGCDEQVYDLDGTYKSLDAVISAVSSAFGY